MKDLNGLFEHFLRDIYYAEKQIKKTLPKMAEKAGADELKTAFEDHLKETEEQISNLEKVFEKCGLEAKEEKCEAIEGIIKEGEEIMKEAEDGDTLDAGLIAAAQAVEHYEISRYGTLISWARQLGKDECADILEKSLDQEYGADRKLSSMAEKQLNKEAA